MGIVYTQEDQSGIDGGISLDTGAPPILTTPDQAQRRADMATQGLENTVAGKPHFDFVKAIMRGEENSERSEAAAKLQSQHTAATNADIVHQLASKQGPLTPQDLIWAERQRMIAGNPLFEPKFDPSLVFETNYADSVLNQLDAFASKDDASFWNVAKKNKPEAVDLVKQAGYVTIAQSQYLNTLRESVQEEIKAQSPWGYAADFAKIAFPVANPYYELKMRGNVPGVGMLSGLSLSGNIDKQIQELYRKPFPEWAKTVTEITNNLRANNPQMALAWLNAMGGQSYEDRFNNNMNTAMQVSDLGILYGMGKGLFGPRSPGQPPVSGFKTVTNPYKQANIAGELSSEEIGKVKKAVGDMVNATAGPDLSKVNTAAAAGDLKTAAMESATKQLTNPDENAFLAIKNDLGDWMNGMGNNAVSNPGELSKPRANILKEQWNNWKDTLLEKLQNVNKIDRIPLGEAKPEDLLKLNQEIKDRNPEIPYLRFSDPYKNPINNTWYVDGYIGFPGGTLWMNPKNANEYMKHMGIYNGQLEQQGAGYMIKVTKPVPENGPFAKDFIANQERKSAQTPGGWVNSIAGTVRTAEDTMSAEQRIARKATVYAPSVLREMSSEIGQYIKDVKLGKTRVDEFGDPIPFGRRSVPVISRLLAKKEWNQFEQMMRDMNKSIDPKTNKPGRSFESPGEMDNYYWQNFNRPASWAEHQAYQASLFLNEMDRIMREISVNRNQARLFGETHTIVGADGAKSEAFTGMRLQKLPKTAEVVAIVGDKGESAVHRLNKLTRGTKEPGEKFAEGAITDAGSWAWWNQRVKLGEYKLIEIYNPEERPLEGFQKIGDQKVRYVLTKAADTEPLRWTQVNRTGGIHHVYEYDGYAKQAIMRKETVDGIDRWHYEGDRNLFGVSVRKMGQQAIDNINEVLRLVREGKMGEAKLAAEKTPFEWSDLVDKMSPKVVDGKFVAPRLDPNEPVHYIPKGRSVAELDNNLRDRYNLKAGDPNAFVDGTKQGSAARAFQVEFTGERDADNFMGLRNVGTVSNPIFKLDPADIADPLTTLNRSLNRIVKQNFVDDYKISAVQAWLKEASQYLKEDLSQVWAAPFYHFKTATRDSFVKGDNGGTIDKAIDTLLANKLKIDQLVGTPHWMDTKLHAISQDIADFTYSKTGFNVTPSWLLPTLRDPFQYARSFTFNAYLGLFAIPQLLVQNMTYASIFAIAPGAAVKGSVATILHQMSRINGSKEIGAFLDKTATKFGWKPGSFSEAYREGNKTGFFNVAGEFGPLDVAPNVIKNGKDTFLSWGQIPFREGERNVRLGAWYTAFHEWRTANPTAAITDSVRNKILDRADLLYGNMSTASNSFLHTGVLSTATQFYAYNIRLAELFLSGTGRTGATVADRAALRARMLGVYSLLYGVPGAMGLSGLPAGDWFRKQQLEGDIPGLAPYKVGDNAIQTMFNEGIPSMIMNLATGNWYNFGTRYGVQGFTAFRDILYSDTSLWKIALGASGTLISNTWKNSDGLAHWVLSYVDGSGYKPKIEDAIDFFKEIQSVNRSWMLATALTTGKWINKNSDTIENVSAVGAWGRYLTGLNSQEQADTHIKGLALKDRSELAKYGEQRFEQEFNRSMLAASKGDYAQADDFMRRAVQKLEFSGWPQDKMAVPFSRAFKKNENLIDRIDKSFYIDRMQGINPEQRRRLLDTYSGR